MARFIILKNGQSHKIFDFEGNIARAGSGSAMDLVLESPGIEGDLFFLTKIAGGYEFERRAGEVKVTVNGVAAENRVQLKEGDKVAFLDYLMIATYTASKDASAASGSPMRSAAQTAPPTPKPIERDTGSMAAHEEKPVTPVPTPQAHGKGSERATTIINYQELSQASAQSLPKPTLQPTPDVRKSGAKVTDPNVRMVDIPQKKEPAQSSQKKKIEPAYVLCGLTGQHKGKAIYIDTKEFVVGRERSVSDLVIDHNESGQMEESISRDHFMIASTDEGLFLTDKKSKLRTFINRKMVETDQRESIAPEDIISIPAPTGEIKFRLCYVGQENFSPDKPGGSHTKIILILAAAIVILIIVLIWLLGVK